MNTLITVLGVATLLWNGHIFSNWASVSTFSQVAAVATTLAWVYLFGSAYQRAYR